LKIMGFDFGLHNLRCLRVSHWQTSLRGHSGGYGH
jgi:hypothetical protein